jgi:lipoprotein-releasing system permease protein
MSNINTKIAYNYIKNNKRLTVVAALGILIGMSVYIFLNSMLAGFDTKTNELVFRTIPAIKVFKDDELSKPFVYFKDKLSVIINPKIVPNANSISDPNSLIQFLENQKDVLVVTPQVSVSLFYNNGKTQFPGSGIGIIPDGADKMYDIKSTMVDGSFDRLKSTLNGIVVGSGIAKKMNLGVDDNLTLTSSKGVAKTYYVVGIFKTNNSSVDKRTSYINLNSAQQLLQEGSSYVSDINIKITDPEKSEEMAAKFAKLVPYKVEGWKEANASLVSTSKIRKIILTFVSITVLIVAAFGIYSIVNMTVTQKINDIAILKAIGFKGKDIVQIFVIQAISIGMIGVLGGVCVAILMVAALKKVYISADVGYFPIYYEPMKFLQGILVGLGVTFFAGYIPAKKASNVDPVEIFRK